MHGGRAFLPIMLRQDEEGHAVNMVRGASMHRVNKHVVVALSETVYGNPRRSNARMGVSVLRPGMVNTRLFQRSRNRPADATIGVGEETAARGRAVREYFTSRLPQAVGPADVADMIRPVPRPDAVACPPEHWFSVQPLV